MRRASLLIALLTLMSLGVGASAFGKNSYWQVDAGNWSVGSNWRNGEPTWSDSAYVSNGGVATIDQPGEQHGTLYLGYLNGERGTLEMTAGGLSGLVQYVGYDGTGTLTHSGGNNSPASLYVGYNLGSYGTYNLSQTGQLLTTYDVYVGYSGSGLFIQTGGTATVSSPALSYSLYLGYHTGSSGTYELTGTGQLFTRDERVGVGGTGIFIQSGGTNTVSESLSIGVQSGSRGTFIQNGGTNTVSGSLSVGFGSSGTYTLSERAELSAGYEYIGHGATGSVTQIGGTNTISDWLYVGYSSASNGTYSLSAGELRAGGLSGAYESIGHNGVGYFTHTGGRNTITGSLVLAYNSGSSATYTLDGTGELFAAYEHIGRKGTGTFTQTGGTNTISDSLYLGYYSNSSGTYDLTGGTLTMKKGIDRSVKVGVAGGTAVFNLGDAGETGVIDETGIGGGVNLIVQDGTGASGTFRGWGTVGLTGTLKNNGRIVADGYGAGRTLDLSRFSAVTNDDSVVILPWGLRGGWYAENQGKLILPPISVATGSNTYNWGEQAGDSTIDLVNSLRISLTNVTSGGDLSVSLLTPDNPTVPPLPTGSMVGLWDFSPPTGFAFASADLTFRYDDTLAGSLGINEQELNVYRFTAGSWVAVTTSLDTMNNRISAEGIDSFSAFAVGVGNPPPPTPNQWNLSEGGYYGVPSHWSRNSVPNAVDAAANFLGMIEDQSTVQVQSPVTLGTINFSNANSYTIAGPAEITLQTSSGDARITVEQGDHTISAPLSLAGGLTVDTAAETTLRFTHGSPRFVIGDVTKEGLGEWVLDGGILPLGQINVNNGTLQVRSGLLAMSGGDVNIAAGATLQTAGAVSHKIVAGDPTAMIVATGPLTLGDQGPAGYNFAGILDVGAHPVTVLGPPGTPVVSGVLINGGTLTGAPELQVAPGSANGYIFGTGEVSGTVRMGAPGDNALLEGLGSAQKLEVSGLITGGWDDLGNVRYTGSPKPGFSPFFQYTGVGSSWPTGTALKIGGTAPAQINYNPIGGDTVVTGTYSQFYATGTLEGQPAGEPTMFLGLSLVLDESSSFNWDDLRDGDTLRLIMTGPRNQKVGTQVRHYQSGLIAYGPDFQSDLMQQLANLQPKLAPGLEFGTPYLGPDAFILTIVPEPGTLVLLLSGGLGLLLPGTIRRMVGRRRRS